MWMVMFVGRPAAVVSFSTDAGREMAETVKKLEIFCVSLLKLLIPMSAESCFLNTALSMRMLPSMLVFAKLPASVCGRCSEGLRRGPSRLRAR